LNRYLGTQYRPTNNNNNNKQVLFKRTEQTTYEDDDDAMSKSQEATLTSEAPQAEGQTLNINKSVIYPAESRTPSLLKRRTALKTRANFSNE
jgi:hypothetical protein